MLKNSRRLSSEISDPNETIACSKKFSASLKLPVDLRAIKSNASDGIFIDSDSDNNFNLLEMDSISIRLKSNL